MKTLTDWKDFFFFLQKPDYLTVKKGILPKTLLTLNSFILKILLITPLILGYFAYLYFTENDSPKILHENVTQLYPPIVLYTMVAIYEEFSFRGFLTKFNPLLFSVSIVGIIAVYFKKIAFHNMMFEFEGLKETGILVLILFPVLLLIAKKYNQILYAFWEKKFKLIVYTSAFLFAFIHFFNSIDLSFAYLKTTMFQLIGAFILSFVRIRSGLVFAIVLHFIWNTML